MEKSFYDTLPIINEILGIIAKYDLPVTFIDQLLEDAKKEAMLKARVKI